MPSKTIARARIRPRLRGSAGGLARRIVSRGMGDSVGDQSAAARLATVSIWAAICP